MNKILLICFLSVITFKSYAIDYTLSFKGSGASTVIDSVIVQNLTKGTETVVFSGNVLKLTVINSIINAEERNNSKMSIFYDELSKNSALKFNTEIGGKYTISAYNIQGMKVIELSELLQTGENLFNLRFPQGIFIINITGSNNSIAGRFVSPSTNYAVPSIEYRGNANGATNSIQKIKLANAETDFNYSDGDILLFKAKSGNYCTLVSAVPTESKTIDFEFVECKDASGKHYAVTKIGNQFWMAENLSYLPVAASDFATGLEDENAWQAKTTPYYYVYNRDKYGVMYNWYAAIKAAPLGWHLPSKEEWFILRDTLGGRGVAGGKMKSTSGWNSPNIGATNSSCFSVLGGGYRSNGYGGEGTYTAMWSSTQYSLSHSAYPVYLSNSHSSLVDDNDNKYNGFYIRCVMDSVKPLAIETALIPAGTFMMGSPEIEVDRSTDETQHQVTLSAFRMSKYEITNAQYAAFLNAKNIGENGLYSEGAYPTEILIKSNQSWGLIHNGTKWLSVAGYENFPVTVVTWYGATEFATYLGGTLPTEAQWEYACRAGTTTPFNTGNCLTNADANYRWDYPYSTCTNTVTTYIGKTQPVGTFLPNAYGLHDMHGNVYEWCSDRYGTYPTTPQINPISDSSGSGARLVRGGSWYDYARDCRSAYRSGFAPYSEDISLGFRVVFATSLSVETQTPDSITDTRVNLHGNVTGDPDLIVTERGFCYSTTSNPTVANNKIPVGAGFGAFTATINSLNPTTIYYVRAYAINEEGTSYGDEKIFTTLSDNVLLNIQTVNIPAGTFMMGSPSSELYRGNDETQHQVSLSAFRMSKYEITNAQYAAFLNANGIGSDGLFKNSTYPDLVLIYSSAQFYEQGLYYYDKQWRVAVGYENVPVVYVTWFGAFEFAKYLGGTLPTESQWEYACRGGTNTPFNTGDCLTNLQANYLWASPYGSCTNTKIQNTYRQKVGLYPANQYGLYDMHGNVYEWCGSAYISYPTSPQTDPPVVLGDQNVIRGGYWGSSALECRSAARLGGKADEFASYVGFRVVLPQTIVMDKPTVSTTAVSYIALTTAMSGGNVIDNGVASITARGVCYSTNANPTIADSKTFDGYGTGTFTSSIAGLTANTTYFIRAYATNSVGTSYGEEKTFTTLSNNIQANIQSVVIPAGTFTMGSPTTELNRTTGETQHQVTLGAFRMSKYEITNAQYADFLNTKGIGSNGLYAAGSYPNERLIDSSNGHEPDLGVSYVNGLWIPRTGFENHPVIYVTWYGASEFAKYAGGILPTEAQWEYACRAGSTTPFNTGNCLDNTQANYNWNYPQTGCTNSDTNYPFKTVPVSYNLPNTWGLYNMHGNVWEWCSDWYGEYPTTAQTNPTGATTGTIRVIRGGSYITYAYHCRSANRGNTNSPNNIHQSIGFRVAFLIK